MNKTPAPRFFRFFASAALLLFALAAGCEHESRSKDATPARSSTDATPAAAAPTTAASSSELVGSWKLVSQDGSVWYAHFASNGSWKITDDAAGNALRVYGTYECSGNQYTGPMVNPHVGEGKIEGSFADGALTMDFVEYWHTPAKHVPYTGTKL